MQIKDSAAIVTGGASGLGAAVAHMLNAAGAKVAIFDRQAPKAGGVFCECDVTSEDSVKAALAKATAANGAARIVINCAGILGAGRILSREGPMALSFF